MPFAADPPAALSSGRWRLRALQESDAALEQEMSHDADVVRWTMYPPALDQAAARQLVRRTHDLLAQRGGGRYAIVDPDGSAIGTAGVVRSAVDPDDAEVFYALLPRGRGRGAATAAARVLSDWALAHGAQRVLLLTIPGNTASEAVARRAGFRPDGAETRPQRGEPTLMNRWTRVADPSREGGSRPGDALSGP